MALVQDDLFFDVTLADCQGNKSTLRFHVNKTDLSDLATDIADLTGAGGLLADLEAITDAKVIGYRVGVSFAENGTPYAAAGVNVEEVAEISARINATAEKYAIIRVPAPVTGIFVADTGKTANTIDAADSDLQAFLANFQSLCKVSDGENIADPSTAGNVSGKRIFRASRK